MAELMPVISVLMPARNAVKTIGPAIKSILAQTMNNFELIIYDDASEDQTAAMVQGFADTRIRLIRGLIHKGTPAARNILLREAKGEYIAWLDADDLAFPERLERQLNYLKQHPEADLLFSYGIVRNAAITSVNMPADIGLLKAWLMFRNPFIHVSLMARNFFYAENIYYDERMVRAEDFELYLRLAHSKQFAILPEFLVSYDDHHGAAEIHATPFLTLLLKRNLDSAGIRPNEGETERFLDFLRNNKHLSTDDSGIVNSILNALELAQWPVPASVAHKKQILLRQWFRLFRQGYGTYRRAALGKLLKAGPKYWWYLWKNRVRYSRV